jgi:hypothetical protein
MYAARVQYNILDAEPGYYLQSTYYGSKNILAIGASVNTQSHAAGAGTSEWNASFDVLFEEKLSFAGDGVVTVEAAYYLFRRNGLGIAASGMNQFDLGEGEGTLFLIAFLIPTEIGWGKFQPHVRYQGFDGENANGLVSQWDFGVNYVMKEHNARVSLVYSVVNARNGANPIVAPGKIPLGRGNMVTIGTQVQF